MNQHARTHIEARLRDAQLKLTPQRFAVLDYLMHCGDEHPSADQISAALNRRFPRASRATVYNTLHALRDAGLVHEVYMDDKIARYDSNIEPHHHFVCRVCDKLEDVALESIEELPRYQTAPGYYVETYEVVMRGVCASCSGRAKSNQQDEKKGRK
jgi:Fe2+ or Zn2+ uptake regulation protein